MSSWHKKRGMTLLEVLVAISVMLVMSAIVFETLRNAIEFNELLNMRDQTTRTARVALSKLRHDLQMAYLTPQRQATRSLVTVFVGEDDNPDHITFNSLGHERMYLNSRECDQTEISIWTETAPEEFGQGLVLLHREAPRVDEEPDEDGKINPIAYNVRSFNLRYLDPRINEWQDEWDTRSADTPYRLPRAVEIGLVLIQTDPADDRRSIEVPFLTTALLEYGERLTNLNENPLLAAARAEMGAATGAPGPCSPLGGCAPPGGAQTPFASQKAVPKSRGPSKSKVGRRGGRRGGRGSGRSRPKQMQGPNGPVRMPTWGRK